MDHVRDHFPGSCTICAMKLDPKTCCEPSTPLRYQTFDLPEKIKPVGTEHRFHELECPCGHRARAEIPAEISQSQFGPRVHAAVAYLISVHKIGRRGIVEIMNTLFGLTMSLGSVCNCIDRVGPELEPVADGVRAALSQAVNLNIDETGWKCKWRKLCFGNQSDAGDRFTERILTVLEPAAFREGTLFTSSQSSCKPPSTECRCLLW